MEKLRQKILAELSALRQAIDIVLLPVRIVRGNVFPRRLKCGKPQCKCAKTDYRHESWYLAFSEDGINRVKYVEAEYAPLLLPKTAAYRRFRTARQVIAESFRRIISYANKIERIKTDSYVKAIKNARKKGDEKTS